MKLAVFWFRRDLRLKDNTALIEALKLDTPVLPIFIFDPNILSELCKDDPRVQFIYNSLIQLNIELASFNSSVKICFDSPLECFRKLLGEYQIKSVFTNKDYEPYAVQRDLEIKEFLQEQGISLHQYKDQVIHEEKEILKNDGTPYTVFTPYKNKWLSQLKPENVEVKLIPQRPNFYKKTFNTPTLNKLGFSPSLIQVKPYQLHDLENYHDTRDFPAQDSTSYLSPHLRFGTISVREVYQRTKNSNKTFVSELIWREFFMQILYHFPKVVHQNFKEKYNGILWRNNTNEFSLWCEGKTGYPLVDAGMRQLNATGYMHNRVRMITAGFLCKHLLIDWRWGEAYFAKKLLDYELSSNNGNWQWSAGTGCDAAPYFRIFNPTEQVKKFDKNLSYIKHWVPEYGSLDYPNPIVDHKEARERALETYKKGLDKA